MAIPGVAGTVVGFTGTAGTLKALVRDKTPAELGRINRESLWGMGIDEGLADYFTSSPSYDPQEQTLLVGALASMTGVKNRSIFVEAAAAADEEPVANFMRVRAQTMALYHEKYRSIDRFVDANGVPLFLTKNGVIVGIFPLDHVAWTAPFAQKATKVSAAIQQMPGVKGKEFWITGTVDPVARKTLEDRGWKVEDKVEARLLK